MLNRLRTDGVATLEVKNGPMRKLAMLLPRRRRSKVSTPTSLPQ
jgi:hypothetical protein